MSESGIDAVVAGHICLDIIPTLEAREIHFAPGQLVEVGPAVLSTGGPVSNTGLALHRLGIPTRLVGKVGQDLFGQAVLRILEKHGVSLASEMVEAPGEASSYSIILSPPGKDRMFLHCAGCNDTFRAADVDSELLEKTRLFHFGYPPIMRRMIEEDGQELIRLFEKAKEAGATTSLDMTMPDPGGFSGQVNWPAILSRTLRSVDIFLPSLEEILWTLYPDQFQALSAKPGGILPNLDVNLVRKVGQDLLSLGPKIAGLKLGSLGLYLRTSPAADAWSDFGRAVPEPVSSWWDRELWSPCFRTEVVGTTGAGDATIAGFLAGLLRHLRPESAVTAACAVGACNVEAADALSGLQSWSDTLGRIETGWERRELPLDLPGWRRDPETGVWWGPEESSS